MMCRPFSNRQRGFDAKRKNIPHGKLEGVEYDSKTVGTRRKMLVHTPPGYPKDKKYPALYPLHGIGGDEWEWFGHCKADTILDHLLAESKTAPMIVVMPSGRARKDNAPAAPVRDVRRCTRVWEFRARPLRRCDSCDRIALQHAHGLRKPRLARPFDGLRAVAAVGMAPQGCLWMDRRFFCSGGPADGRNSSRSRESQRTEIAWLSCGNQDNLIHRSQGIHAYLKVNNIPHIRHVSRHGQDAEEWKTVLYVF